MRSVFRRSISKGEIATLLTLRCQRHARATDGYTYSRIMNISDVREITEQGESAQIEFKKSTGQRSATMETVCAMLNGGGEYVLIGVKNDGTIIG